MSVDLLGELDELDFGSTSVRCSFPLDAVTGAFSAAGAPPLGDLGQEGQFPLWKEEEKLHYHGHDLKVHRPHI